MGVDAVGASAGVGGIALHEGERMMKAILPGVLAFVFTAMVGQASGQEQQVA